MSLSLALTACATSLQSDVQSPHLQPLGKLPSGLCKASPFHWKLRAAQASDVRQPGARDVLKLSGLLSGPQPPAPTTVRLPGGGPVWARSSLMTSTARQTERCPPVPLARMVWEWEDDGKDRKRKRWKVRRGRREKKETRGKLAKNDQKIEKQFLSLGPNFLSATTAYFTFSNEGQYSL